MRSNSFVTLGYLKEYYYWDGKSILPELNIAKLVYDASFNSDRIHEGDQSKPISTRASGNYNLETLTLSGNDLYVGGEFDGIGNNVAHWNGRRWQALGEGVDDDVYALLAQGGDLYASGFFRNKSVFIRKIRVIRVLLASST